MAPITFLDPIHMAILDASLAEMLEDGSFDRIINETLAGSSTVEDEVMVVAFSSGMKNTLMKIREFMANQDDTGVVEFIESSISAAENVDTVSDTMTGELAAIQMFCHIVTTLLSMGE